MSLRAVTAEASSTVRPQLARPFTTIGLGYLALVPVLLVLVAQFMQVGFGLSLASTVPISDTNVWSGCASAISHFSTPVTLDWCLKRPSQMFLQAPLFLASPNSMGAAIVLQTLELCALLWWLLCSLAKTLPVTRLAMWVVYLAAIWPVAFYGTQLGTESPALALSLIAAASFLRLIYSGRIAWGFLSGAAALLAFQMRPGNIFLTVTIVIGVMYFAWRKTRRWLIPLVLLVGFFLVWWLPDQLLKLAGWSEAGHASNFWSVLYSAASPDNDTWEAAYVRFAKEVGCSANWNPDPCMGLETFKFAGLLRDGSLQLIRDNPLAIPRQVITNLTSMFDIGFLNQMWVNPFPPVWKASLIPGPWHASSALGVIGSTVFWLASWALLAALIVGIVRLRGDSSWKRSRLQIFGSADVHRLKLTMMIGLLTIVGSIVFFGFVGHDEPQRHMVTNIPFVLLALGSVLTVFARKPSKSLVTSDGSSVGVHASVPSRWGLGVLVVIIVGAAVVEGHATGQMLSVARSCSDSSARAQDYLVMSKAHWNGATSVQGPSDWRVLQGNSTQSFPAEFSWPQTQISSLPPGNIMTLRSAATGDIIPVFLADNLNSVTQSGNDSVTWCTQIPSQYNSIIVHDLERAAPAARLS